MAAFFGGIAFWLHRSGNGAFIFLAFFFALTFFIFLLSVYRVLFYKILVGVDGFYYQTTIGNGKRYRYTEVKKAWISSGRSQNGAAESYCNISFYDGTVIRFLFYGADADAVDYLIERATAMETSETANGQEAYRIDGKHFGKSRIVAGFFIFVVISVISFLIANISGLWFMLIPGVVMAFLVLLYLIMSYGCFKVEIDKDGFYCRTTPWNGRYYTYREIISCREIKKVVHHHAHSTGNMSMAFYFFFEFTCADRKKRRFLFEKPVYEHEINVLKERIKQVQNQKGM